MTLTGTSLSDTSVSRKRIENDYYATPPESTRALLERESGFGNILEACCGEGHISEVLKEYGLTYQDKYLNLVNEYEELSDRYDEMEMWADEIRKNFI